MTADTSAPSDLDTAWREVAHESVRRVEDRPPPRLRQRPDALPAALTAEMAMTEELPESTRAVVHDRHGNPGQVLRLAESQPLDATGPGQVTIRVTVRPIHPGDLLGVAGDDGSKDSQLASPRIPGMEGAGVVVAVGSDVVGVEAGQRVAFFPAPGAWADYVTTAASAVVPVPEGLSEATAALMLVNPLTALMLLRAVEEAWAGTPRPFVQTAAGSSVARLIAAAAERHEYPLVNLVRSTASATALSDRFPSLPTIATSDPDWQVRLRDALGGAASVVLDPVGGTLATALLGTLEDGGSMISYGQLSGPTTTLRTSSVVGRELRIRGVSISQWSRLSFDQRSADIGFALATAQSRPDLFGVAATYDLADFEAAIDHVDRPGKVGTVLLTNSTNPAGRAG
ncbi:zinc-binding dehydrogenase [soil metagenome]